jgi:hypothetical protein
VPRPETSFEVSDLGTGSTKPERGIPLPLLRVPDLGLAKGASISRLMSRTRDPTVMRRCQVVLHFNQGFSPPKIAKMIWWSEDWVRRIIQDFNRVGRDAIFPPRMGGRPPTFTPELRQAMVDRAPSSPKDHGFVGPWTLDRPA